MGQLLTHARRGHRAATLCAAPTPPPPAPPPAPPPTAPAHVGKRIVRAVPGRDGFGFVSGEGGGGGVEDTGEDMRRLEAIMELLRVSV